MEFKKEVREMKKTIVIKGQIVGGKNQILVTRTGARIPSKLFSAFEKDAVWQLKEQWKQNKIEDNFLNWRFIYTPRDHRRRDVTAVLDSVFHCLEKASIVADDSLIQNFTFKTLYSDKENPKMVITIFD